MHRYYVGDQCTYLLCDIVYQQQHKSRDSNDYFSDGSIL